MIDDTDVRVKGSDVSVSRVTVAVVGLLLLVTVVGVLLLVLVTIVGALVLVLVTVVGVLMLVLATVVGMPVLDGWIVEWLVLISSCVE